MGRVPPLGPFFFIFMKFSADRLPNKIFFTKLSKRRGWCLPPPVWEILDPQMNYKLMISEFWGWHKVHLDKPYWQDSLVVSGSLAAAWEVPLSSESYWRGIETGGWCDPPKQHAEDCHQIPGNDCAMGRAVRTKCWKGGNIVMRLVEQKMYV